MGSVGSRPESYGFEGIQRRRLQKTRSLSLAESPTSNAGFYPPPILHNLYPELENPIVVKELGKSDRVVREHRAETMLVDMVLTHKPVHVQLSAKVSSASSSSSGCESSTSEDTYESFQRSTPPKPSRGRMYAPRLKKMTSLDLRLARLSVDSGTGFDDEDQSLPEPCGILELEKNDFKENLPIEEANEAAAFAQPSDLAAAAKEQLPEVRDHSGQGESAVVEKKKKRKRARSLGQSLKSLRMRAFSLQSVPSDDRKRKREKPANELFGSSYLNREWEIVTVEEVCRRLSLDRLEQYALPIPEGATSSQILDVPMIRQIMTILPPRAEGYPWVNIYNSEKHGFSLFTLYRRMQDWDEELSPILLLIRDCNDCVFGAIASTALRPCEHYVGTGDSCLLFKFVVDPESNEKELQTFKWTGANQFFVKASKDSLSMGAGGGHFGLWLDADLNHGRSLRCETFDNEPLSNGEDFDVQFLEAYGFKMG